jgi:hypothetical protein
MNQIKELHENAMRLAEMAVVSKLKGDLQEANNLFQEAYEKEAQAARLMTDEPSSEPTRSILYRSAASLALDCNQYREAERLVALGLAGHPPEEIAVELRDLFDTVNFERHLDLRGITLQPDEVQMSIAGKAVSPGVAPSEPFITRVLNARNLIYRTVERMMGKSYREGGAASRVVRDYSLFISIPRAASFAVSLRISRPKQPPLPVFQEHFEYVETSQIIDEILSCLDLFNRADESKLRERIPEKAYFRNFVGVVKNIVPDGKEVNLVGFTAIRRGAEKRVELTTPRNEIKFVSVSPEAELTEVGGKLQTITGRLKFADAVRIEKPKIKLVDEAGKAHPILVPEGMMSDIVRPMWDEPVTVTGYYRRRVLYLEDIVRASIG